MAASVPQDEPLAPNWVYPIPDWVTLMNLALFGDHLSITINTLLNLKRLITHTVLFRDGWALPNPPLKNRSQGTLMTCSWKLTAIGGGNWAWQTIPLPCHCHWFSPRPIHALLPHGIPTSGSLLGVY